MPSLHVTPRTEGPTGPEPHKTLAGKGADSPAEEQRSGAHCSRLGCCRGNGFAQEGSPGLQPVSTAATMQPVEPPAEQTRHPPGHDPRVKKWEENQPHP